MFTNKCQFVRKVHNEAQLLTLYWMNDMNKKKPSDKEGGNTTINHRQVQREQRSPKKVGDRKRKRKQEQKNNNTHGEKKQGCRIRHILEPWLLRLLCACVFSVKMRNSRELKYLQNQGDAVKHSCNRQRGHTGNRQPREHGLGMAPRERGQQNGQWYRVRVRNC